MKKIKRRALEVQKLNSKEFNFSKTVEELNELSLELIQKLNKPKKLNELSIEEEMAHVQIRLWMLEPYFNKYNIKKLIKNKINQIEESHASNRRHINSQSFK